MWSSFISFLFINSPKRLYLESPHRQKQSNDHNMAEPFRLYLQQSGVYNQNRSLRTVATLRLPIPSLLMQDIERIDHSLFERGFSDHAFQLLQLFGGEPFYHAFLLLLLPFSPLSQDHKSPTRFDQHALSIHTVFIKIKKQQTKTKIVNQIGRAHV